MNAIFSETDAGVHTLYIAQNDGTILDTVALHGVDKVYAGVVTSDDTYVFLYVDSGGTLKKGTFTQSTGNITSVTLTGITLPSVYSVGSQQYWQQGSQEWVMDQDHFYYRTIGDTSWASISDSGSTTNAVVWYHDGDEIMINWVIWKDSIYKIFGGGGITKIQNYTGNAYVGYADWFANGTDEINQLEPLSTYNGVSVSVLGNKAKGEYLKKPICSVIITDDIFEKNDYVILYDEDDSDKQSFEGWADQPLYKRGRFSVKFRSPLEIDLKVPVNESYTDQKASYILKDMLKKYAKYFYYTSTSIDTTDAVITGTIVFKGKLKKVFDWANKSESYFGYWHPNGEFHWDDGLTDSGIDIITIDVKSIDNKPDSLQISKVTARGGFVDGERLEKYAYDSAITGGMNVVIAYPSLTDPTILQNFANDYRDVQKQSVNRLTIVTYEKGFIQVGHQVDFQYDGEDPNISFPTLTKWFVMRSEYDFVNKKNTLVIYDKLYYPIKGDQGQEDDGGTNSENNEELLNQNASDINQNAEDIEDKTIINQGITATASEINTVADGTTAKNTHTHSHASTTGRTANDHNPEDYIRYAGVNKWRCNSIFQLYPLANNSYFFGDSGYAIKQMWSYIYTDLTPFCDLETAKRAVNSFVDNGDGEIDHIKMDAFILNESQGIVLDAEGKEKAEKTTNYGRNIGASVTANMVVIQDLLKEINLLKARILLLEGA
ncbi:MAG: hypothetical protein ACTSPK_00095 [Candidatus Heimdallarchaeota archaeon]